MAVHFIEKTIENKQEISPAPENEHFTIYPHFVDDLVFKWDGGYLHFFGSDEKEFENIPKKLKDVIANEILFWDGYIVSGDEINNKEIFERYFDFELISKEAFDKFKDFFPNKIPYNKSYWFCHYWIGLNRKVLVEFRFIGKNSSYFLITQKRDVTFESIIKKVAEISTNPLDKLDEIE